jgi:LysM repeat protein
MRRPGRVTYTRRPRGQSVLVALLGALGIGPALAAAVLGAEPTVVVVPGDTLSELAVEHGVPVEELVQLNAIANSNRIFAGQVLRLRPSDQPAPPAATAATRARTHRVAAGENLTWIARRYGVSLSALLAANSIADPNRIFAGQAITIPGAPAAAASRPRPAADPAASRTHRVAAGENLTWIARRYGVTLNAILAANDIPNPSRIFAGQTIHIPGASGGGARPSLPAETLAAMAARQPMRELIVAEAERQGVPVALALGLAWQESGWRQDVVSRAGAIGVMQLLPATADWVADSMLRARVDVHEARDNITAGIRLLAHYLDRYDSTELALAAYYQGQRGTDRHGVYPSSRSYVRSILALQRALSR